MYMCVYGYWVRESLSCTLKRWGSEVMTGAMKDILLDDISKFLSTIVSIAREVHVRVISCIYISYSIIVSFLLIVSKPPTPHHMSPQYTLIPPTTADSPAQNAMLAKLLS